MKIILLVGLPYFTSKTQKSLLQIDSKNKYFVLNTYYSLWDRIKFLVLLPFASTVYSVNGTLSKSKAIDFALLLKKRVVMHWVGSDVFLAKKVFKQNKHKASYISKVIHLTDTPWLVNELEEVTIKARFLPLFVAKSKELLDADFAQKFSCLLYIPQHKQEFYGISRLQEIAEQLPEVNFFVAGTSKSNIALPNNVHLLGWIENMTEQIKQSVVCIRFPEYDGLSFFVLEALMLQRYVIYNQPLPHTFFCQTNEEIVNKIKELYTLHQLKQLSLNKEAKKWIFTSFSEKNLLMLKSILINESE